MKFKTITLIVLFVFIAFFAVLAFVPESKNLFKSEEEKSEIGEVENTENTPIEINSENNSANLNTTTDTNSNNSNSTSNSVVLTTAEIAKHNKANDCYLIVKGSVYSVAAFIDKHPGGRQKILDMCGKEATAIFSAIHSNFAWNLLKDFYIGKVGAVQTSSSVKSTTSTNTTVSKSGMEDDENEFERD